MDDPTYWKQTFVPPRPFDPFKELDAVLGLVRAHSEDGEDLDGPHIEWLLYALRGYIAGM